MADFLDEALEGKIDHDTLAFMKNKKVIMD